MRHVPSLAVLGVLLTSASGAGAAPLTVGNLLVSTDNVLYEYTPAGVLVQDFDIPYPIDPRPTTEHARDIAVEPGGARVFVFNGTFDPYLSTLDVASGTWTHETFPGWSIVNNATYGGAAMAGDHVFVADHETGGTGDEPQGVVRFSTAGGAPLRFATDLEGIDVEVGEDGVLYVLTPGSGRVVNAFSPGTLGPVGTLDLQLTLGFAEHRAIDADGDGNLYVADLDGDLQSIEADGTLIDTLDPCALLDFCALGDVDVLDGVVVAGSAYGEVLVTDASFSDAHAFVVSETLSSAFVTIVPEPGQPWLAAVGALALWLARRPRRA